MDNTKELTHLSLCSGYEGIGRGLRAVFPTLREIAYVEIETYCIANLVKEMEAGVLDTAPIYSDLKTFPFKEFRGQVCILSGGFPCQPFSNAGVRRATEDPRHLFPYIRNGIRDCQPRIVFLENVEGIISAKTAEGESVLQYVLKELEGLGYIAEAGIFSASEVGAPHQRKRVFILGYSKRMWESQPQGGEQIQWRRTQHPSEELGNARSKRCKQDSSLRSEQQSSRTGEVSRESRIELGNTQHDGHTTAKELRGCDEASDDKSKGQKGSIESEGAGGRSSGASIQGCDKLAHRERSGLRRRGSSEGCEDDPNGFQGDKGERDNLWSKTEGCRDTSRGDEEVGNAKSEGLQGWLQTREYDPQGWQEQDGCPAPDGRIRSIESFSYRFPSRPGEPQQDWEAPRVTAKPAEVKGATEPRLGGATNGSSHRIDRLRLLGNGVVPQVATKAFVTLFSRLYE